MSCRLGMCFNYPRLGVKHSKAGPCYLADVQLSDECDSIM